MSTLLVQRAAGAVFPHDGAVVQAFRQTHATN
ncbi:hypothetical protein MYIN104542_13490 [Mycobacterium intermedium]